MSDGVQFDRETNTALLGGQSMVFHCHHYNCVLQRTIEERMGAAATRLLSSAASEVARPQLAELVPADATPEQALAAADRIFSELGFGRIDASGCGPRGGSVVVRASHYAMGWVAKFGDRPTPACHFVAGFLAAAVGNAYRLAPERVGVTEVECYACAAPACRFAVEVL